MVIAKPGLIHFGKCFLILIKQHEKADDSKPVAVAAAAGSLNTRIRSASSIIETSYAPQVIIIHGKPGFVHVAFKNLGTRYFSEREEQRRDRSVRNNRWGPFGKRGSPTSSFLAFSFFCNHFVFTHLSLECHSLWFYGYTLFFHLSH